VEGLRAAQQSESSVRCQWSFEGADMTAALRSTADTPDYDLTAHGAGIALVPGTGIKSQALNLPGGSAYAETPFGKVSPPSGTLELIVTPASATTQHGIIMKTNWNPGPKMNSFGILEHERTISAVVGKDAGQPLVGGTSPVPFHVGDSYYVVLTYSYRVGDGPGGEDDAVFEIDGYAKNLTSGGELLQVVDASVAAHGAGLGWAMFALGRDASGNGQPWSGNLDEVAFYNAVLSAKSIAWHVAALADVNPPPVPVTGSKFVDKTAELGIIWPHPQDPKPGLNSRKTAAWVDYDNDGYVDLSAGMLWRNNRGNRFSLLEFDRQVGPNPHEAGPGIFADIDNDGFLDRFGWRSHLKVAQVHRNMAGTGTFGQQDFPKLPQASPGGFCWADLDGDGYVDLYVGGGGNGNETDAVAMNHNGASFTVKPIGGKLYTRSVIACDYDEDRDMDIFTTRYWFQPNALFQNDGAGNLTDVGGPAGVHGAGHTISGGWADFDNDGHFDLFACNFNHHDNRASQDSTLYQNLGREGGWKFKQKFNFVASGYWQESYGSCALADYDNDGDVDIFITTVYGGDRAQLFRNDGNWKFTNVTVSEGLGGIGAGLGQSQAAWGDYDNDGDVDLVTDGRIFQNQGNANHWLSVRLAGNGTTVNRAAIGAQARIKLPNSGTITRQVGSGAAVGNQHDLVLHFGLGWYADEVDLKIAWPDGSEQVLSTAVDRIIDVRQAPRP
jgi:hypothetical protein